MKHYDKLIFVSESDTITSPMAEAILSRHFLLEDILILSKGLVVLFPEPINPKAEAVLVSNGLTMKEHMSDPLLREDFSERTLIMTFSESLRQKLVKEYEPEHEELLHVLNRYVGSEQPVMDPYGGSLADYGQCFAELEALIAKLVIQLNEEELLC